jgi:hypothetical protein
MSHQEPQQIFPLNAITGPGLREVHSLPERIYAVPAKWLTAPYRAISLVVRDSSLASHLRL